MNTRKVTKIIAIDDDPTGSQTVHSCLLLTRWDKETLLQGLRDDAPLFFVLSNTRGMDASRAGEVTREICGNLRAAIGQLAAEGIEIQPVVVSRSDSTLRGHYPVETDVIEEAFGPFDAHFLIPAFFEGGRITRGGMHYLMTDGKAVPVHETEFAKDSLFGFTTAYLPDYVEEKTAGRIHAAEVECFSLDDVRGDCSARLHELQGNRCCVVDAEYPEDLDSFARQVLAAAADGKRFLFRSAASLLTSLAALPPQPVAPAAMAHFVRDGKSGVVLMGSHVGKSTRQLECLQANTLAASLHIDLDQMLADEEKLFAILLKQMAAVHASGRDVVLYTSRGERLFASTAERLAFGERVSGFLMRLVRHLPHDIGFLISKGGITSNDTLSTGLELRSARVVGQILPGCSMVLCPDDHPDYPSLPVVIFPGNVGGDEAIAQALKILGSGSDSDSGREGTAAA